MNFLKKISVISYIVCIVLFVTVFKINQEIIPDTSLETQPTAAIPETSPPDASPVNLEFDEVRAVWVSYITLDMQNTNMDEKAFTDKFNEIINTSLNDGFNTLIVQVRPFCDALYKSKIFPMSHILTGEQGKDCGYDPLEIMCTLAHKNNMKIEAWLNPYRVSTASTPNVLSNKNPYSQKKSLGVELENGIYLNPALDEVMNLICDGAKEIVENYDVDGIHFDDYFYPTVDESFDKNEYDSYLSSLKNESEALPLMQWRKQNVNTMVKMVYEAVHSADKDIVFGISPQGNLSNNENLCADIKTWCENDGYIDYICPQIYFSLDNPALTFENALSDWTALNLNKNINMYVGIAGYKAGSDTDGGTWLDNNDILKQEIEIIRENNLDGFMLYSYDSLHSEQAQPEIQNVISLLN